jgi:hypothetical protein
MALFLSESVAAQEAKGGMQSFAEGFAALFELSEAQGALVEAILVADYTMEQRCKNLSEGETMDKIKGFATKVWESIKSMAKTAWAKIKEIASLIMRKAKEYASKAVAMFKGDKVKVSKSSMVALTEGPRVLEQMIFLAEKGVFGNLESEKEKAAALSKQLGEIEAKSKAAEGVEEVAKSVALGYAKAAEDLGKKLDKAVDAQIQAVNAAEAKAKGENVDEIKANAAAFREALSVLKTAAAKSMEFAVKATTAIKAAPAVEKDKKD